MGGGSGCKNGTMEKSTRHAHFPREGMGPCDLCDTPLRIIVKFLEYTMYIHVTKCFGI